jgi:PAB1-binding protein PBP1
MGCDGIVREGAALPFIVPGRFLAPGFGTLRGLFDAIAEFGPRPGLFVLTREGAPVSVRPANGFWLLTRPG